MRRPGVSHRDQKATDLRWVEGPRTAASEALFRMPEARHGLGIVALPITVRSEMMRGWIALRRFAHREPSEGPHVPFADTDVGSM